MRQPHRQLSCFPITVGASAADQILSEPLHLCRCFFHLLGVFVSLPWKKAPVILEQ